MVVTGKSIRVFLADGSPTGLLVAEIVNWTGKVLVVNRADLQTLARREEAGRPGVYVLAGADLDKPGRERVYIGESENVFQRLLGHNNDESKDFWSRTVLILSKDENLTKGHIRYLESRLIQAALKADRATVDNGTKPAEAPLPEPDRADMEFFLEQVTMLLPVLGYSFLKEPPQTKGTDDPDKRSPIFEMKKVGAHARAREIDGEFVVLEGSTACVQPTDSWAAYKALRQELIDDGVLAPTKDRSLYRFSRDVPFSSPSAAAAVVRGSNLNGRVAWKLTDTGQTYAEWQEERLKTATVPDREAEARG